MIAGYVYILLTKNNHYYVGSTKDLQKRLIQYKKWDVITTKRLAPVKLLFYREYNSVEVAKKIELWIKKQKSKKLIEKFMSDKRTNPFDLQDSSVSYSETSES